MLVRLLVRFVEFPITKPLIQRSARISDSPLPNPSA